MPGVHWTESELKFIIDKANQGLGPSEIQLEGKSSTAIGNKLRRLGILGDDIARSQWPEEHVAVLQDLVSQGFTARQISRQNLLPYNVNAIQKKMGRLKLSKKKSSFRRLPAMILDILEKFLKDNWAGNTPEELAAAWNKQYPKFQATARLMIYHLDKLNLKVPYYEVMKIRKQKEFEAECRANGQFEAIRANRIRIMTDRFARKLDIWTGLPLDKLLVFMPYAPEVIEASEIIEPEVAA